jgi:hypothetical protein
VYFSIPVGEFGRKKFTKVAAGPVHDRPQSLGTTSADHCGLADPNCSFSFDWHAVVTFQLKKRVRG